MEPKFIGKGSYSRVYRVSNDKVIKIYDDEITRDIPFYIIREIAMLQKLRQHPNILPIYNMKMHQRRIQLLLPYCDSRYNNNRSKDVFMQIVDVLQYCHRLGIVHRDLKPDNILLNQGRVYLIDFNISRRIEHDRILPTREITTLWYRPPEVLVRGNTYGRELDVWSLGCLFAELLTRGKVLFKVRSEFDLCSQLALLCELDLISLDDHLRHPERYHDRLPTSEQLAKYIGVKEGTETELLSQMLQLDPNQRIPLQSLREHPFFEDKISITPLPDVGLTEIKFDHWTRQLMQLSDNDESYSVISMAVSILDQLRPLIELNACVLMVCLNVSSKYLDAKVYRRFLKETDYAQYECEILMMLKFNIDHIDLLNYMNLRSGGRYDHVKKCFAKLFAKLLNEDDIKMTYGEYYELALQDELQNSA